MKRRLNILCLLICVAVVASIINYLRMEGDDAVWGAQKSRGMLEEGYPRNDVFLFLSPDTIGYYSDSVYNVATGTWLPLQYRQVVVQTDEHPVSIWVNLGIWFSVPLIALSVLIQIITFIKLIRAINKSVIFEWSNVVKLRTIGVSMLISFALFALFAYLHTYSMAPIEIQGYTVTGEDIWQFMWLIPGLSVLLVAEIFAIGLRMKEEQELTI